LVPAVATLAIGNFPVLHFVGRVRLGLSQPSHRKRELIQPDGQRFIVGSGIGCRIMGCSRDVAQGRGEMMSADSPDQTVVGQVHTDILLDGLNEVLVDEYGMGLDQDRYGSWPDKPAELRFCVSSICQNPTSIDLQEVRDPADG